MPSGNKSINKQTTPTTIETRSRGGEKRVRIENDVNDDSTNRSVLVQDAPNKNLYQPRIPFQPRKRIYSTNKILDVPTPKPDGLMPWSDAIDGISVINAKLMNSNDLDDDSRNSFEEHKNVLMKEIDTIVDMGKVEVKTQVVNEIKAQLPNELKALLEAEIKAQLAKDLEARKNEWEKEKEERKNERAKEAEERKNELKREAEERKNEREKEAEERKNELKKEATERNNQYKQIQAILKTLLQLQASSTNAALQLLDDGAENVGAENDGTENNGAGNI